ncbi:hypothetical protein Drorol1_Dr00018852 [Drosera rotundifolia]
MGVWCWGWCRQVVIRARNLKQAANFIPTKAFRARRVYFCNEVAIHHGQVYGPRRDCDQHREASLFSEKLCCFHASFNTELRYRSLFGYWLGFWVDVKRGRMRSGTMVIESFVDEYVNTRTF